MYQRNINAGLLCPAFFWFLSATLALLLFHSSAWAQAVQLPVTTLTIDTHKISAEVAATESSRNYGLMHRMSLPPDTGMLFVFDAPGQPCFWMKNTPLPLSIAFINHHGIIVNMADMQPHSHTSHCPRAPVLYALEMEQGWFASNGIAAGDQVLGLP